MIRLINIVMLVFIFSFESCAMGSPKLKDFQGERGKLQTFYWPCEVENKFCSKTCGKRKSNGTCKEWIHREKLDVNNDLHWSMIKNGDFILIKRVEVFK